MGSDHAVQAPGFRNLAILMTAQCIGTGGVVLVVTVGGIVGTRLAPDPAWATLPMSLMVVGTAACAVPAALLMRRIGRRRGFALAAAVGALAALLAVAALRRDSFVLFSLCTALFGATVAFTQQYRFGAAESVPLAQAGRAISLVLVGAVGGAFLGPVLANLPQRLGLGEAVGVQSSFAVLAGLLGATAALLLFLRESHLAEGDGSAPPPRPFRAVLVQPLFIVAVLAGVVGQGVMTFVMTATPIAMHVHDGFSLADTAGVIRAHVLAMYLPSLASAMLIGRLGVPRLMALGVAGCFATVVIALQGHDYVHYWVSLALLGVGWNFLFVGATSLLVASYRPAERFGAQATNDFCVFGVAALGSLAAGTVVHAVGWEGVLWGAVPLLAVMVLALLWLSFRPGGGTEAPGAEAV